MNFSATFIRRPVATALLMAALFLVGAVAYPLLPVAPLPQVDFPTIVVTGSLPGASPETMASNVAQPLERQLSQIPGVTQMTSLSALGTSSITVQFDLNRNIDAAAQDIQSAINAAGGQLPTNLPSPPTYRKVNPADSPILVLALTSRALPLTTVSDYADNVLAQQISQISGVAQVSIPGQQKPAVRLQIDPAKIAAMGLNLEDVRNQAANATVDAPKGYLAGRRQSFTLYDNDQLLAAAPWNDVIVAYRNGSPVRIRDIGQAVDGPENLQLAAWANADRAILLAVFKEPGANVIDTVERIKAALPRLQATVPQAIDVRLLFDRTQTIRASVADVEFTLMLTAALVVMVIFLFLRSLWATAIPSVTVPLALVGTFAVMYAFGFSLDNLSLMALTIAVGFVVDDAIVMLENVYRHVEEGMSPLQAALKGAGEIGFTILSISISLIAVFIPLLLMGGIVGRLLREFAITVTIAIAVSVIISLTLTPMLSSRFLKNSAGTCHGQLYRASERVFDLLLAAYERGLRWVLRHQRTTLAVFLATVIATAFLFIAIPKGFFPQQDTGFISGVADAEEDMSFAGMSKRMQQVAAIIRRDPAVDTLGFSTGTTTFNTGTFYISLKPKPPREDSIDAVIGRLRPQLAQVIGVNVYLQANQDLNVGGRLSRTQYQYTLQDADLAELNHWAPIMLDRLQKLPQLTDVASDQQIDAATATLTIDRDQAARFGIQPQQIDAVLYDALGQRQVTQYFTQLNSYHVILEVLPGLQGDPAVFDKIYLTSPLTGGQVPLSTFVKYDMTKTNYLSISHQGQFPAVTISFNLAPGAALGEAVAAIGRVEASIGKPATVIGSFQGTAQAFQSSLSSEPYLIAAALAAVYIILGILYESFIHPLTILSTLPSAGLGALLTLMAFGFGLDVVGLIGIILLIGIVKKNGIMMVDFALAAEREQGLPPEQSILQACLLRFRPIMMTTMCALLGGLPLMLGHGIGSELRRPLGFAMVGGLLVSQALTLFTTPVVYLYLDRFSAWLADRRRAPEAARPRAMLAAGEAAE
jgi:HAE1 family hydrophobic/amphiphilic exporter-1